MCCQIFKDVGYVLLDTRSSTHYVQWKHAVALLPKVDKVGIVCQDCAAPGLCFTLLILQVSTAYGAAAIGANKGYTLPLDYVSHTSVLYHHET